jgi:nickel transport protein
MRCLLFILLFLLNPSLQAEFAWIEPQNQSFSVLYGQKASKPYLIEKIKEIKARITKGLLPVHLKPQEQRMDFIVEGKPAFLTLYFDDGFWSKISDGKWLNQPKNLVSNAQESIHTHLFAKTILQWEEIVLSPVGQLLEIVPRKREDGELIIQVLFEGNPLENTSVFHNNVEQPQKTNDQGLAKILLNQRGRQFITVEHRLKTAEVETDENIWTANLLFFEDL